MSWKSNYIVRRIAHKKLKMFAMRVSDQESADLQLKANRYARGNKSNFIRSAIQGWIPRPHQVELIELIQDADCRSDILTSMKYRLRLARRKVRERDKREAERELMAIRLELMEAIEVAKLKIRALHEQIPDLYMDPDLVSDALLNLDP